MNTNAAKKPTAGKSTGEKAHPPSSKSATAGSAVPKAAGSILLFLIIVEIASGFVQGFYTPLLPELAGHVGVTSEAMNWFQTAQAMAAAILVPLLSRLGDVLGPRKVLRAAMIVVLIGTLLIALVPSFPVVLIGRVLIGPLGVWLPLAITIIYVRLSGESATRAITLLSASLMLGVVVGTITAGVVDSLSSSMVVSLLVPSLVVLIAAYGVFFKIPADIDLGTGKIDWLGFAGLGLVMITIIYSLGHVGYQHMKFSILLLFITGVIFVAWVAWEQRVKDPAVDLGLVVSRKIGPLYLTGFVMGIIITDAPPNLAAYMSSDPGNFGYGFSASTASISLLIAALLVFATAGAFASSFIAERIGMRVTLVGAALLGALGQLVLVLMPHVMGAFWIQAVVTGFGVGILSGSLPALVSHAAPEGKTGVANGLYTALLAMGGAVGGAVFKKILETFHNDVGVVGIGGYMAIWGFLVLAFLVAAAMLTMVEVPSPAKESTRS